MTGIHVKKSGLFGIHLNDIRFEGIHLDGIHLNEVVSLIEFSKET